MLNKARAMEIVRQQAQWPYWGNFRKFMTEDEIAHVEYMYQHAMDGRVSFASIVLRMSENLPEFQRRPDVPPYEDTIIKAES